MESGDLLEWRGARWLVRRIDGQTRTAFLVSATGDDEVLGADEGPPTCQVICNPAKTWPFVTLPSRKTRLIGVSRLGIQDHSSLRRDHREVPLTRLTDWVKADDLQQGGALFLNPALRLVYRDRLIALYEDRRLPIEIPRDFRPVAQKIPIRKAQSERPKSLYDHVMDDDDE